MKINTKLITISAILALCMSIVPAFVNAQVNGGDDVVSAPAITTTSVNTSAPSNGSDDITTTASTVSVTSTNTSAHSNGFDDANQSGSTPTTPTTPSGGTSGGSSGGSGGSTLLSVSGGSSLPTLTNLSNCLYITTYMKFGGENDSKEVTKLQTFLKNTEKIDVNVNGIFDQTTFDAVKSFQAKYVNDVMAPWGVTTPTGQVWYTTKKKINEIYCKSNFALTPAQIAEIEAYRKNIQNPSIELSGNGENINATGTIPLLPEVGTNDNGSLTAGAGFTSFASKVWSFIKWLFGY